MQTIPGRTLRLAATLALVALVVAPTAFAQIQNAQLGTYGTRVKVGDFDYLPLTKRVSGAVRVMEFDAGVVGDVRDNCVLLMMDNTDGGTARPVVALPATGVVYTKDIRMTPCQGKAVGTAITDADIVEQLATYTERAVEVRYGDPNGSGKYDRTDPVFITTMTGTTRGLAPSTTTGSWTIRITPTGTLQPGFVFANDADFIVNRDTATGPAIVAGTTPAARTWSLSEREGNGWYLVPASAAGLAAQSPIPVNSVRIGIVGVSNQQPLVVPSAILLPSEQPVAGEDYKITVKFSNDGTGTGQGVLVTKIDGVIVDVRITPVLAPGEGGEVLISVPTPEFGGPIVLEVSGSKVRLDVQGASSSGADSSQVAALEARIAQLETHLLETQGSGNAVASTKSGIPGVGPLAVLGLLGLMVAFMRRRAA
ncbi:MAG: hypothetical protein WC876_00200 [Candidatus Thermoplasmatota archaeon]|jgi:hypothetical protein